MSTTNQQQHLVMKSYSFNVILECDSSSQKWFHSSQSIYLLNVFVKVV